MYTQGQSVLNRSLFPCQDTPAIKATYSAVVNVPDGFTAIMSANKSSFGEKPNRDGDKNCHFFEAS
jgi:aminopeptidase B